MEVIKRFSKPKDNSIEIISDEKKRKKIERSEQSLRPVG